MDISTLRLWQLISPALPVGAYAYSQGQAFAVDQEWITDEASAFAWIRGVAKNSVSLLDLPVMSRMFDAWVTHDEKTLLHWSRFLSASRESSEILAEDRQLGKALARLLSDLEVTHAEAWRFRQEINFPVMFALATYHWKIDKQQAMTGLLWAWCENQVAAAIKIVPLGQTAGQRILSAVIEEIPAWVDQALQLEDDEIGVLCQGLAIGSAKHETQYSRLFRS